jgi:hypothetical protein
MPQTRARFAAFLLLCLSISAASFCSGNKAQTASSSQPAPNAAAQPPASQTPQQRSAAIAGQAESAATAAAQKPSGPRAAEKYQLSVTNYAKVPVTVSLNGEWLGQWDSGTNLPLDGVVQGKNQLTAEMGGQANGQLILEVFVRRDNQDVKILSANLQGLSGTHTYTFMAK